MTPVVFHKSLELLELLGQEAPLHFLWQCLCVQLGRGLRYPVAVIDRPAVREGFLGLPSVLPISEDLVTTKDRPNNGGEASSPHSPDLAKANIRSVADQLARLPFLVPLHGSSQGDHPALPIPHTCSQESG